MNEVILTEAQNGERVSATTGDILVLRLQENPTTGYRWEFQATGKLAQIGDDFITASAATGAGGERCLRFVVQASGVAHIEAVLRRSWEAGIAPQAVFKVSIEVS